MVSGNRQVWVAGSVVAGTFLLLNLLADGFPIRCVDRTQFRYTIGLPDGVSYDRWYREKFGTDAPPRAVVDWVAVAKNSLAGTVAVTVTVFVVFLRRRSTKDTAEFPPEASPATTAAPDGRP
jgi:hypothetical protein